MYIYISIFGHAINISYTLFIVVIVWDVESDIVVGGAIDGTNVFEVSKVSCCFINYLAVTWFHKILSNSYWIEYVLLCHNDNLTLEDHNF